MRALGAERRRARRRLSTRRSRKSCARSPQSLNAPASSPVTHEQRTVSGRGLRQAARHDGRRAGRGRGSVRRAGAATWSTCRACARGQGGILRITAAVLSYRGYYASRCRAPRCSQQRGAHVLPVSRGDRRAVRGGAGVRDGRAAHGRGERIATKYLATPMPRCWRAGFGRQARTQVDAVCAVRPIREIRAWSPTTASRAAFCADIQKVNKINAVAVDAPEQAVRAPTCW